MTTFSLFVFEFVAMKISHDHGADPHAHDHGSHGHHSDEESEPPQKPSNEIRMQRAGSQLPGEDHLGHSREHTDNTNVDADWKESEHDGAEPERYAAQTLAFYVLEGGVIFHSIFIGLTLAVSGDEFRTLYVVLVFHQTFEGLALGSRLSAIPWPKPKRWMPYLLGLGYGLSTPLAIAIGLGVRGSYAPGSQTALVTNGVFDSISAGILIYTALVELMAHEFMFSTEMMKADWKTCGLAIGYIGLGAGKFSATGCSGFYPLGNPEPVH
jgi:solute carrier family 39 (zinc transporter), member 1/2/3